METVDLYSDYKFYGPYTRKDGRKIYTLKHKTTGNITSVSYPKYLMEVFLGRRLTTDETVDHIDRDFTNDDLGNLRVIDRKAHVKDDAKYLKSKKFICPQCEKEFEMCPAKLHKHFQNRKDGKAGPFCGRSCAGRYSSDIQNNKRKRLEAVVDNEKEYYYKIKA